MPRNIQSNRAVGISSHVSSLVWFMCVDPPDIPFFPQEPPLVPIVSCRNKTHNKLEGLHIKWRSTREKRNPPPDLQRRVSSSPRLQIFQTSGRHPHLPSSPPPAQNTPEQTVFGPFLSTTVKDRPASFLCWKLGNTRHGRGDTVIKSIALQFCTLPRDLGLLARPGRMSSCWRYRHR